MTPASSASPNRASATMPGNGSASSRAWRRRCAVFARLRKRPILRAAVRGAGALRPTEAVLPEAHGEYDPASAERARLDCPRGAMRSRIIFIDELDSIGRARGQMAIGGSSVLVLVGLREQVAHPC